MTYKEKFHQLNNWKEKVLLMEFFHLLKLSKNKQWQMKETAEYFNVSIALVSENIKLAKMLKLGIVDNCTSRDKAIRLLRKLR